LNDLANLLRRPVESTAESRRSRTAAIGQKQTVIRPKLLPHKSVIMAETDGLKKRWQSYLSRHFYHDIGHSPQRAQALSEISTVRT